MQIIKIQRLNEALKALLSKELKFNRNKVVIWQQLSMASALMLHAVNPAILTFSNCVVLQKICICSNWASKSNMEKILCKNEELKWETKKHTVLLLPNTGQHQKVWLWYQSFPRTRLQNQSIWVMLCAKGGTGNLSELWNEDNMHVLKQWSPHKPPSTI